MKAIAESAKGTVALPPVRKNLHPEVEIDGGTDEGPPGPRGEGFYAGYFRDPDGNKLNAFVMGAAAA